jgi:adenine-specific DNA-methyltransferase
MDGHSLTPDKVKQEQLKELFPEVFCEGKIDWEKLKATLGEDITFANERYVLNWAGKSDAFKVLQAPTTKTLIPAKDESVNFDETENIFIEGENLEVMKVLQKSYFGKVKMIYIDPPYNTGNDSFIYPDKFSESKADYEKRVGDKDEEGYMTKDGMFKKNSKENGQYHSNWLNMMYPRLFLAKNLLREDGVIFISIDDNEVHNLRQLMNEIFGEENFLGNILWKKKTNGNNMGFIPPVHDFILSYTKSVELIDEDNFGFPISEEYITKNYSNPDNHPDGLWTTMDLSANHKGPNFPITNPETGEIFHPSKGRYWVFNETEVKKRIADGRIIFGKNGNSRPVQRVFLKDRNQKRFKAETWWDNHGLNADGTKELNSLFEIAKIFDHSKPSKLLKNLVQISTLQDKNEIILDFFAGTASFAHAVMDLNKEDGGNRKYICVQLSELCDEKSEAYKAGYKTIADIAKERIRRVIGKINEEKETLGKETATLMEKVAELQQQIEELKKSQPTSMFNDGKQSPEIEKLIKQQEAAKGNANENIEKMDKIDQCDKGFKVLKLNDSNFKQWLQINGKDANALEEQMKLFIDPVAENATIENMVYELLLKSGKDLNCKIERISTGSTTATNYFKINENELVFMLEKATPEIIDAVLKEKPLKVVALDKLFKGNDQLKTNTVLQMKDAGVEFKTI